jgi:hypothetical protein
MPDLQNSWPPRNDLAGPRSLYTTPHARRSPWLPTHATGNVKHRILAKKREKPESKPRKRLVPSVTQQNAQHERGLKLFSGMPMPHVKHGKGEVRRPAALRSVPSAFLPHLCAWPPGVRVHSFLRIAAGMYHLVPPGGSAAEEPMSRAQVCAAQPMPIHRRSA